MESGDSADLPEFKRRLYVGGVENIFDGDAVGAMADDELFEAYGNMRQARGHGVTR